MVKCMEIFNIKNLLRVIAVVAVCTMSAGAYAYSGADDDDDYNDCQYFSPAYALCTVHSYNVGLDKNPTDGSQVAEMNRIIALKSTVIAQQMKQQYDVLNAMVKRFKTQLEKSVLTNKMEVLTGNASGSSSSGGSSSSNSKGLDVAENCDDVGWKNVHDCLRRNLNKINQAAEKDTAKARQQLTMDFAIAVDYHVCDVVNDTDPCSKCRKFIGDRPTGNKKEIQDCVSQLKRQVDIAKTNYERENAKSRYDDRN